MFRKCLLLALVLAGCGQSAAPTPTAPPATSQAVAPTRPSTPSPTARPTATATSAPAPSPTPAAPPTATAIPPTVVQAPPTATPAPPTPTGSELIRPTATPPSVAATSPPALPTSTLAPPIEPTLAPSAPADPPPAGLAYVFPVQPAGPVQYGSCHHDYPASDMFTPIGSQFVAPTSGVVDWVTRTDVWEPQTNDPAVRGGLSVAMIGDDGVRYYGSHLSQVSPGIEPGLYVQAGHVLGLTGKSGDAVNTPAHLHFGISQPTTPDDWAVRRGQINPYPYLNAWRNGENRAPDLNVAGGGAC